jgi:hypothetical protein
VIPRIVVSTSDKYIQAIRPFAWLMKKYWPGHPEVVVLGFTPPSFTMPDNFIFHSIGRFDHYPVQRWSDAVYKGLSELPDEIFILMLEDYWITRPVHDDVVRMCADYMEQFKYVARIDMTGDRLHAGGATFYGKLGMVDLIWSDPDSPYHMSFMAGMWRKEHLFRVLVPNETPWDVEIHGTTRLSKLRDEVIVLGTNAWPIKHTLAYRGGDNATLLLDEIEPDDVAALKSGGLI